MKYPVLIVGIVLFGIFLSQDSTKKWWNKISRRYVPSTCDAVMDRVAKKAPSSWDMECPDTQALVINIKFDKTAKSHTEQRVLMYKQLANTYSKLAHFANVRLAYFDEKEQKQKNYNEVETLERLPLVRVNLTHPQLAIASQSDGQAIAKYLVLKREEAILKHLQLTVKVTEKTP